MDPQGLVLRPASDAAVVPFETSVADHFVLAHHGIARCTEQDWTLRIDGLVERELHLSLEDLRELAPVTHTVVLECAGNPEDPDKPTRFVSNARWRGVPLRELLALTGVGTEGRYVWLRGADSGTYAGVRNDSYLKDIPVEKARSGDVLIAYEMNDEPLTAEHGFPLRAVVSGYYGTNSVKWLTQISVQPDRPQGLFTTRLYTTIVDGVRTPVWALAVNSRLTTPVDGEVLTLGTSRRIAGWAWSEPGVVAVDVSVDGGRTWAPADLDDRADTQSWQGFGLDWSPTATGAHVLMARARDARGAVQPPDLHINQTHGISVTVRRPAQQTGANRS